VSLVPSATELIHSLGATDRIVGVTLNDDYPPAVQKLPKVGDQTIDLEKVLSLKPDLVVLDSSYEQNKKPLQDLGIQVLELQCRRLEDIPAAMLELGQALGTESVARERADAFRDELAAIRPLEKKGQVFVEIWGTPLMTVGRDTLINDMLEVLGLENCYADQRDYFQVDPEDVVSRQPEIVIFPIQGASPAPSATQELLKRMGQNPKVVALDADLFFRPGPRLIEGMKLLRKDLVEAD